MKVKALRQALQSLKESLSAWQVKAALLDDLERLDSLLAPYDALSVAQFTKKAAKALGGAEEGSAEEGHIDTANADDPAAKSAKLIEDYVARLKQVGTDAVAFRAVLSELETDKTMRLAVLSQIASQFTGADQHFKSRAKAIAAIEERHRIHRVTAKRLSQVDKLF